MVRSEMLTYRVTLEHSALASGFANAAQCHAAADRTSSIKTSRPQRTNNIWSAQAAHVRVHSKMRPLKRGC